MKNARICRYSKLNEMKVNLMVTGEEDYIKLGLMEKLKCSFEPLLREIVLDSKECISNIHEYSGLGPCKNVSEKDDNKTYDVEEYIIDNF
jgi:hypothetical protein